MGVSSHGILAVKMSNQKPYILTPESEGFIKGWEELSKVALLQPIYGPEFEPYYLAATGKTRIRDFSLILVCGARVLAGVRMHLYEEKGGKLSLSYFGMPAILECSPDSKISQSDLELVANFYKSNGLLNLIQNQDVSFNLSMSHIWVNSLNLLTKTLIKETQSIDLDFFGFRELITLQESIQARAGYPKSVKSAIKKGTDLGLETKRFSLGSDKYALDKAFASFRSIHRKAAGRDTRSEDSWHEQLSLIHSGSIDLFLVYDDRPVGGALFIKNKTDSVYGVAANLPEKSHMSLSHLLVHAAITHYEDVGLKRVWLGNQYSNKTKVVPPKVANIEKFKRYFITSTTSRTTMART